MPRCTVNKLIALSFSLAISLAFSLVILAGCGTPSDSSHAIKSAKVHTELAGLYYERAQLGIALDELTQALQADRDYAPAYSVRGLVHMADREDKEAEEDFKRSLHLDNRSEEHTSELQSLRHLVCRLLL